MTSSVWRMTRARACLVAAAAAAVLAGCSSGMLGDRPQILDNPGVTPSATDDRDEITITFSVSDEDLTRTSVQVHYTTDGTTWYPATLVPGTSSHGVVSGDTVQRISPTAAWTDCQVDWDSYADGVALGGDTSVELRLTPTDIDGTGTPVYVSSFNVNNKYAALEVVEPSFDFGLRLARVPEKPADELTLHVQNGTGDYSTTLYWEVLSDQGWLLVNGVDTTVAGAVTGTTPGTPPDYESQLTLTVDVDGAPLTASPVPYVATLAITGKDTNALGADAHGTSPVFVTVTVTVKDPEAEVFLHDGGGSNPPSLAEFVCVEGEATATPAGQSFWVENKGDEGSLLDWTALDDVAAPDWLAGFEPGTDQGQLAWSDPAVEVTVSAAPSGVAAGRYSGAIEVSGTENFTVAVARASPSTVAVSLWVKTKAEVGLSAASYQFPYAVAGVAYAPQTYDLVLTNLGEQALDWSVSLAGLPSWITGVTPSSGTGLAYQGTVTVTITVDADAPPGLAAQLADYPHTLTFQADNSTTPSKDFDASLHVYNPATIVCIPSTLNFTRLGSSLPASQSFTITRTGTNVPPVQWSTTTPVPPSETWVSTVPGSGTLTTGSPSITVNVNSAGLALGSYSATITLNSSETTGPPATVTVNLTVSIDPAGLIANLADTGFDLEFDAARDQIYVSLPNLNSIVTLSATTFAVLGTYPVGTRPQGISLSSDGQRLYCALNTAGSVAAWLVGTATVDQIGISALLGDDRTYDVLEVNPDELLVTSNPGSNGFAYVVKVDVDFTGGHTSARVADGDIIRARPVLTKSADNTCAYVGSGFSPNSLYKLDMTQPTAPISLEDAHGSVGGTDRLEVSPDFSRIYLRSGQVLRTSDFSQINSIGSGVPRLSADGSLCYVGTSASIQVWNTNTFLQVGSVPALYPVNQMLVLPSRGYIAILSGTRVFAVAIP